MQITRGWHAIGVGLYHVSSQTLVFSDLHLGYEAELHSKGVLVPRRQYKETIAVLRKIIESAKLVKTIVLNGDLKHSFGRISSQEWNDILRLIDELRMHCSQVVVVKGNHDAVIASVLAKKEVIAVDEFRVEDTLVLHGDELPTAHQIKTTKIIIIGHDHPAITLRHKSTSHKYKCYLRGAYTRRTLIVQPSTFPLVVGSDVAKEQLMSPLLPADLRRFEIFVVDEKKLEVLGFGRLGKLKI